MKLHYVLLRPFSHPKPPWIQSRHTSTQELASSDEVLRIVETVNPMEPALEPLVPFLSPHIVNSIIENPPNLQLGIRFFIWASNYKRFYSWGSHGKVVDMLVKEKGFDLYWDTLEEMKRLNVSIDSDAFTLLIQAYENMGLSEKAVEAFGRMGDFSCKPDIFTYNKVLLILMRKGCVLIALAVYNGMLKLNCLPNKFTYSILIDGLCKDGKIQEAIQIFDDMTAGGIPPHKFMYTMIISGLCQAHKVDDAYRLFKKMIQRWCTPDFATYNALLDGFCKVGRVDEAFAHLRHFEKHGYVLGVRGYSCLIGGLLRARRYEEAHALYKKMLEESIKPDVVLYTLMIEGLSEAGKFEDALLLWREMNEIGVVPDTACYNVLIKGYCDMGRLDDAKSLKIEISKNNCFPNTHTYTILISGMCRNGLVQEADEIFSKMEKNGCNPSVVTFNTLIDGLCKAGNLKQANLLFYQMEIGRNPSLHLRLSHSSDRFSGNLQTMVRQLCESGLILKAYKLLMKLTDGGVLPDIRTYNILINGFCKANNFNGAFTLFKELQIKGLSPDAVTYGTLIHGLQKDGREADAFKVFDQMMKNGCTPNISVYNTLMTWSSRRRKVSLAFSLWLKHLREIGGREDVALEAIEEQFENGNVEKAVRRLLEMDIQLRDFWLSPYSIWLIGLSRQGRVEDATKIFFTLEEFNITVTPPSCVMLMASLCKEGDLDLAMRVFLYTIKKDYVLKPRICNTLIESFLMSKDKSDYAFDLIGMMKSSGYALDSYLNPRTKSLLHHHWSTRETENVSPG